MKYTTALLILSIALLSSCSVTTRLKTSQKFVNRQAEASVNDAQLINKPILADLEVSLARAKTNYSITNKEIGTSTLILSNQGKSKGKGSFLAGSDEYYKNEAKKRAQFQFMTEHKCDYLIDPIYLIETEAESGSDVFVIKVEISAFPAVYKKFSQPDSLPRSITQINSNEYRGIPLMVNASSSETITYNNKSKGIILETGISTKEAFYDRIGLGVTPDRGISGYFGYYSNKQLGKNISFRKEIGLMSRNVSYDYADYNPVVDGFGNLIYYEIENREAKERTLGLQMPLALAFEATKFNAYIGTALNLDLLYLTKYRKVGSSSWSSKSVGIDKLESNQIFGLSLVLGASYWVTDNISIGYRHDNGFGDWGWTSNNVCVSFKLK